MRTSHRVPMRFEFTFVRFVSCFPLLSIKNFRVEIFLGPLLVPPPFLLSKGESNKNQQKSFIMKHWIRPLNRLRAIIKDWEWFCQKNKRGAIMKIRTVPSPKLAQLTLHGYYWSRSMRRESPSARAAFTNEEEKNRSFKGVGGWCTFSQFEARKKSINF